MGTFGVMIGTLSIILGAIMGSLIVQEWRAGMTLRQSVVALVYTTTLISLGIWAIRAGSVLS
ncbi:hypothetical protein UFOVP613_2 [uncultured Caudovirales phage]|uniref:Uncharacterized protein n=1 Tax=uncultured Caudovirales phage TaxID=2100421 RepID=A0A6J5N1R7_9CAUD|nr:hypothetical protein UFOVP613_2 [uncultured Caudovirales phage]